MGLKENLSALRGYNIFKRDMEFTSSVKNGVPSWHGQGPTCYIDSDGLHFNYGCLDFSQVEELIDWLKDNAL